MIAFVRRVSFQSCVFTSLCPNIALEDRRKLTCGRGVGGADDTAMSFGSLVSTSNEFTGEEVVVQSDVALVWTTEIRSPLGEG